MPDMELYLGDCLEVMPKLADKSVDAIICDLPYGTTACAWDSVIPFEPLWAQYKRIIKPRGAIALFGSQPFTSALVMSNLEWFKYCWVWEKSTVTAVLNAKIQPLRCIEDVVVFCDSTSTYNPQGLQKINLTKIDLGQSQNYGAKSHNPYIQTSTNYPRQIIKFQSENGGFHPTQKPVALLQYLIKTYTNPGDTVLDNCFGSGTTGVACKLLHRRFVGIEKDAHYFDIAMKRINDTQAPAITDEGVFLRPEQAPLFEVA